MDSVFFGFRRGLTVLLLAALSAAALQAAPISLFDGKTLEGWDYDPAMWRVVNGVITGGSTKEKIAHNDFISTKRSFANFELRLKIRCSGDPKTGLINSGIQVRSVREPGGHGMVGYQVDCGEGWFGKIYDEHRRNKVIWSPTPQMQAKLDAVVDVFGWNEYRIRAEGPRLQTWINGVLCMDYVEKEPNIALDGHIGPQVHGGGVCLVEVKDVWIEELPPTPGLPTWKSVGLPKPKGRDLSYNQVQTKARTAAEELAGFKVPEGYTVELVLGEGEGYGKFVSVAFDQRGRLWTQTALEYPVDGNENPAAAAALYASKGRDKILIVARESLQGALPAGGVKPTAVFADALAMPLGILPFGDGSRALVQHGPDLKMFYDENGDGRADRSEVILTGFGVQDSHLFPHQFTRAPGGWVWMAQGLFNDSEVRRPGAEAGVTWRKCSMARLRPDGSGFEVISTGPNNIWGLAMNLKGETFIQEANDYGYPVMPFEEYAYYPGGMDGLKKTYQPDFPPQAEFRMGGTGLSGLAFLENGPSRDAKAEHSMVVANPITSRLQLISMHRDGQFWKLELKDDFLTSEDPWFRPVALANGPDGCIYIVDWYNKIISHNEVPRAHPDRDKTRGRIWRLRPKTLQPQIADFTKATQEELVQWMKQEPVGRAHMAWQTLTDRGVDKLDAATRKHWAFEEQPQRSSKDQIRALGRSLPQGGAKAMAQLLAFAKPSLPGPMGPSSRNGKQIPIREAYEREFERFLVRLFLERNPAALESFLSSPDAAGLPVEALVLAHLALPAEGQGAAAQRLAALLPKLGRAPNDEELLRLAQFAKVPQVAQALEQLLSAPESRAAVAGQLLQYQARLDAKALAPVLQKAAAGLLGSGQPAERSLAAQWIGAFALKALEPQLLQALQAAVADPAREAELVALLQAAGRLALGDASLPEQLLMTRRGAVAREAALALAASSAPDAASKVLVNLSRLDPTDRRAVFEALSGNRKAALEMVAALKAGGLKATDLDASALDRMATVLQKDAAAMKDLQAALGGAFEEVLSLDGSNDALVQTGLHLKGAWTVEAWVNLAPGIGNEDGLLGTEGGVDMNFFGSVFRVYGGAQLRDVAVARKPIAAQLWTHVAVSRDEQGFIRLYQNGELEATSKTPVPAEWKNCRVGWSGPAKGTQGQLAQFRFWNKARSAAEIRGNFDRRLDAKAGFVGLQGALGSGAKFLKTLDAPPLLSREAAAALDAKFAKLSAAAPRGDVQRGKAMAALCMACHQIGSAGGQIGPNLSGVGSMGLEAILRNILTPNAAMEPGYRIFRVQLKSGELLDGFLVSEDKQAWVIRQPGLGERRLLREQAQSAKFIRRSLMPEGLLDALNEQQSADLLAYLLSLK